MANEHSRLGITVSSLCHLFLITLLTAPRSAVYLAFTMSFFLSARTRFQQAVDSSESGAPLREYYEEVRFSVQKAQEAFANALPLAHQGAQMMRGFRQRYGFKVNPAYLLQLQAVTASVLLLDPELTNPSIVVSQEAEAVDGSIRDSHTAFDEVFRSLLGTGVEVMIARGIARMMYHTALEQSIALSRSTREMLQIMSATAWQPSNLSHMNSMMPNFATLKSGEGGERMTELLSKWENLEI